jgi:ATP-dependent protease HslVU (ClpYQ) peptidase subunit
VTVVVAAKLKKGGVAIAADSQTSNDWEKMVHDQPKIWTSKPYAFGGSGSLREIQVLREWVTWPKHADADDENPHRFLIREAVPAVRNGTANHGVQRNKDGVISIGCQFIMAWGDHLATVFGDGAVVVPRSGRCAIGSGYAEALGSLGDLGPWTVEDVVEAARRSAITARGVSGPIFVVTTADLDVQEAS